MMNIDIKELKKRVASLHNVGKPKCNLKNVNKRLEVMISDLQQLDSLTFDSNLPHDFVTCYRSLIVHRATGKYVKPADRKLCAENAFTSYKTYEQELSKLGSFQTYGHPIGHKIKGFFNQNFNDFNMKHILKNAPVRFSPGETYLSCKGDTSIDAKLSLREHCTVSSSCVDDAAYMIYHCRGLKMAMKAHMPILSRKERDRLYHRFKNREDVGYHVFRYLLIKYVFIIVDGARASSVPKNATTDRFINVEPFFNMLVQACIEWYLRRKLKQFGNDLQYRGPLNGQNWCIRDTQHLHGLLLKDPDLCTYDLKNASDSTLQSRLALLPPWMSACILRTRSTCVEFPDGSVIFPEKVSSMGNGFTFGLMTFLLYFSFLANGISSNVFGDDIIVHKKDKLEVEGILEYLGYHINLTKTFVEHPFRESCGYFHYIGKGYIRSFDIERCESVTDAIVTTNKIFLLWQDCALQRQWDLADVFEAVYKELLGYFQASQKGPQPCGSFLEITNLALYVYDWRFRKKHMDSAEHRALRKRGLELMDILGLEIGEDNFICVPYFRSDRTSSVPNPSVKNLMIFGGYGDGTIRGSGRWLSELCLVTNTGVIYRFGQLSQIWDEDIHQLVDVPIKVPI